MGMTMWPPPLTPHGLSAPYTLLTAVWFIKGFFVFKMKNLTIRSELQFRIRFHSKLEVTNSRAFQRTGSAAPPALPMLHRGQPGGGPRIVAYSDSSSDGGADTAAVDMDDSLESLDSLDNGRGDGADGEYASSSYSPRGHGGQSKRRGGRRRGGRRPHVRAHVHVGVLGVGVGVGGRVGRTNSRL